MVQIRQGETITIISISSLAVILDASIRIRYDDGSRDTLKTPQFTTADTRIGESRISSPARANGIIEDAFINGVGLGARGRTFAQLAIENGGRLCFGYMYGNHIVVKGDYVEAGPGGGEGRLYWAQEANDAAGNIVTTVNLALANTRRMIRAIIVKYHQAGGADATITMTLRDLADSGGPTGWSIESDTWVSPSLVLAANQEGLIHVGEHGFVATNDAGTIAYADNTTAPNPFPFMVASGETVDLIIAAAAGASGDDYDVWVQYEEWLTL